jgi:twitching motility two-component system response regulator PilH
MTAGQYVPAARPFSRFLHERRDRIFKDSREMTIQKILVVDDSKTELYHLSDLLGKRGYSVRTAENGDEALRRLAEEKPDLIMMDVVMPGQNGFQLTRTISRDPRFADVPIIMCTSKNQETDKVWGMRQGARDYIVKPVNADELLAKIRAFNRA